MTQIKILYLLPQQNVGGAETQMINLIENIDKTKFKVYLGIIYGGKELKEDLEKIKNITLISFNKINKLDITIFFKIAAFIKKEKIDIVQTFLSNHHAYLPVFIGRRGTPIGGIRSTNGGKGTFIDRFIRFDLTKLASKSKKMCLISNSHKGKEIYVQHKVPEKSILVIPNGINSNKFLKGNKNKIIKEFDLKKKIVLGIVARIDKRKNHEELIDIFYDLQKEFNNLILLIVGDGPYLSELKKIVIAKKIESKVIFTGLRKDIPDLLKAMDIFVFPSKYPEGWPNAVGEAMCAGVPVISYSCGDVKHIIKSKHDGIITTPNHIRKDIKSLIKNKTLRNYLKINAQNKILKKFTTSIMVKKYEKIYINILKRNN
jgi:glycosyltransferase involved in cell wall biosynthesis